MSDVEFNLVKLSMLAADFKVGILSDEYVYDMMRNIAYGVNSPNPKEFLKQLLDPWYLDEEGKPVGAVDPSEENLSH